MHGSLSTARASGSTKADSTACPICESARHECFRARILRKYEVSYFFCDICGLLQTERPYWLEEAYSSAIAAADTGVFQRNLYVARVLGRLLYCLFDRRGKYLDVAGGYGLLTRLMRDAGFDFYWSDAYCANLFARGFEGSQRQAPFTAVTAFEVLEHLFDPLSFVQHAIDQAESRTFIFSTALFQGAPPALDWWYYSFSTGQHISFYQPRTLKALANKLGLNVYMSRSLHILTDRALSNTVFQILVSRMSLALYPLIRLALPSRTMSDHKKLV